MEDMLHATAHSRAARVIAAGVTFVRPVLPTSRGRLVRGCWHGEVTACHIQRLDACKFLMSALLGIQEYQREANVQVLELALVTSCALPDQGCCFCRVLKGRAHTTVHGESEMRKVCSEPMGPVVQRAAVQCIAVQFGSAPNLPKPFPPPAPPPPPSPRTNWTRLVSPPILIGHAASFTSQSARACASAFGVTVADARSVGWCPHQRGRNGGICRFCFGVSPDSTHSLAWMSKCVTPVPALTCPQGAPRVRLMAPQLSSMACEATRRAHRGQRRV